MYSIIIILIIILVIIIIITIAILIYYNIIPLYNLIPIKENIIIKLPEENIITELSKEELDKLPKEKPNMKYIYMPQHKNIYIPKYQNNNYYEIKNGKLNKKWIGQNLTKQVFQEYLNEKNINNFIYTGIRPNFLKNKSGKNLEYDIYDKERKLAIEYNGIQHYFPGFFNSDMNKFIIQYTNDKIKYQLANKNGDIVIIVPFYIDVGEINKDGTIKYINKPKLRKEKIKNYLYPILDKFYI